MFDLIFLCWNYDDHDKSFNLLQEPICDYFVEICYFYIFNLVIWNKSAIIRWITYSYEIALIHILFLKKKRNDSH